MKHEKMGEDKNTEIQGSDSVTPLLRLLPWPYYKISPKVSCYPSIANHLLSFSLSNKNPSAHF